METILVTGGAGFIGCNFVRHALAETDARVVVLDKLTYAGQPARAWPTSRRDPRYAFVHGDIADRAAVRARLRRAPARRRSSTSPPRPTSTARSTARGAFIRTNVVGHLRAARGARGCAARAPRPARLPLPPRLDRRGVRHARRRRAPSREATPYAPNSPYAASKAGADHLVRAYHETYGLPTLITNCSNNYGPYQFPEKLIPLMILNAIEGKPLPIYGDGGNVRDWLYVEDHCEGILLVLRAGAPGEKYNIGGGNERTNLEVVDALCAALDGELPAAANPALARARARALRDLKTFVADRPGHDRRYAIDAAQDPRASSAGAPRHDFEDGPARRRCAGTSSTATGARPCRRAATGASASAC